MTFSHIIYVFFLKFPFCYLSSSLRIANSCEVPNCLSCSLFKSNCNDCIEGYYLNIESKCIKCNEHCLSCTSFTCKKCESNYIIQNDQCVLDKNKEKKEFVPLEGCLAYNDRTYDCVECEAGYLLREGICDNSIIKKVITIFSIFRLLSF